jgi:hypothetical protein
VTQYVAFVSEPAKATILKRTEPVDDVEAEGEAGFDDGVAVGDARARLRRSFEDKRRSYPNLSDAHNLGQAWLSLSRAERDAILAEEDSGDDPTFDHERVDVGKLASFALECSAAALQKAHPSLNNQAAFAAACDAKPELFKIVREARRADLVKGNAGPTDAVVAARHYALQLLTAKAHELRKAQPTLTVEAARVEARRLFPEIAARERA